MDSDLPGVYPCTRRKNYDDKSLDYVEIVCDGKAHVNVGYKNGVEVTRSKRHACDRWTAYSQRLRELKR